VVKNVDRNEMIKKIMELEDFIHSPKHQNSLNKLLAKTENPLENTAIARILLLSEEQVVILFEESVEKLRKEMAE
jgi:hypothetical protein